MKELITYITNLLKNPADFDLHRHENEDKLAAILNAFADERPPTIEQMIEALETEYPSLQTNVDLIEKGDTLRTEMMDKVFDPEFQTDEVKKYEARISLFDKMIEFDKKISQLILSIGGIKHAVKESKKKRSDVDDTQGSAQRILSDGEKK